MVEECIMGGRVSLDIQFDQALESGVSIGIHERFPGRGDVPILSRKTPTTPVIENTQTRPTKGQEKFCFSTVPWDRWVTH